MQSWVNQLQETLMKGLKNNVAEKKDAGCGQATAPPLQFTWRRQRFRCHKRPELSLSVVCRISA